MSDRRVVGSSVSGKTLALYRSGILIGSVVGGEVHALSGAWGARALCGIVSLPRRDDTLTRDHISCNRCRRMLRMPRWIHA